MTVGTQTGNLHVLPPVLIVLSLTLSSITNVLAGQVYKSIDADGNVTYSSTPAKEASQTEKMNIPAKGNPATNVQENSNTQRINDLADEMEKERIQRQDDRAAARKKREEAYEKKQTEEAKKQAEKKAAEPKDRYYPVYVPLQPQHPINPGRPIPKH